jgi:hypothetical protein
MRETWESCGANAMNCSGRMKRFFPFSADYTISVETVRTIGCLTYCVPARRLGLRKCRGFSEIKSGRQFSMKFLGQIAKACSASFANLLNDSLPIGCG